MNWTNFLEKVKKNKNRTYNTDSLGFFGYFPPEPKDFPIDYMKKYGKEKVDTRLSSWFLY